MSIGALLVLVIALTAGPAGAHPGNVAADGCHYCRTNYNRALSTCYTTDGTNLNAWLVRHGYALAYRRYSTKYVPEEDQARAARAGLWAAEFVAPWAWWRGQRLD